MKNEIEAYSEVADVISHYEPYYSNVIPQEKPIKGKLVEVRTTPKIGRNQTCPCGSGQKYKRCCGNK